MDKSPAFSLVDVALTATGVIWGVNSSIVKFSLREFSPLAFNSVRFAVATLLILAVSYLSERSLKIERRDVPTIILTGFIGNTLYQILFIHGINLSTAGNTALVLAMMPVCITILARIFGREDVPVTAWLGIGTSLAGVVIVTVASGARFDLASTSLRGDLLTLAGVFCWSAYTIMVKPLVKRYSALRVTALAMAWGTLFLIPFAVPALLAQDWTAPRLPAWAGLISSACLAIVFAYIMWSWGVSRLGGARAAAYENLTTVVGVLSSWLILHEPWTPLKFSGAALTLVGLAVVRSAGMFKRPAIKPAEHQ